MSNQQPKYINGVWLWELEEGGYRVLTPHELELLKEGAFHDE